ncbi:Flavin-containing amine [Neofusicoccum parvum]|uniref:Amine oxidase n=2 Tax=Neofusicoccum parvum TaxID=310453 RepID=R1GIF7_BOTPV|nr:putative flavin-containing amine protein [Neofusicoccum parvum UCRNP2]GME34259.1 Flavin-containing amine [Neofusicoccum parvum]GME59337.1 Flavin-containing amine [Neofusicoccum parvum]
MSPSVKALDPPGVPKAYHAAGTISNAGSTIQVSGQVGATPDGTVPASYESQIHLALLNLRKVLTAARAKITDISKLTLYIVNYDPQRRLHTKHLQKFLGAHRPAITLVPVLQLANPSWLFEIDAVASIAPAAPAPLPSTELSSQKWTDVVVIGAGLSGLAAARDVTRAGLSCLVLEARDRVGGKTWSKPLSDGTGVIDLGAAWINDTNQSRMFAMAQQFGAELIEQNTTGNCVLQDFDGSCSPFPYGELPRFDAATQKHLAEIRDMVEAHCQKVDTFSPKDTDLDSLTFEAYLRRNGASEVAVATATVWTRAMLGHEPSDISALYFLNYCKSGGGLLQMRSDRKHGGQYLRCRQGMQIFSIEMAKALPAGMIRLSDPVHSLRHVRGGVQVESARGIVHARKVIISVPSPVLRTIAFDPPLPFEKTILTDSAKYGYYTKVMMVFKTPFWVDKGFCGLAQSFRGPAAVVRDTSVPADQKWVLTCFLAGEPGREWAQLSESGQVDALLAQIGQLFADPETVKRQFVEKMGHEWIAEQHCGIQ